MVPARRILVFSQDSSFLKAAGEHLSRAALEHRAVSEPSGAMAQVASFEPDLILLDRMAAGAVASEVVSLLQASSIPLVFVLADSSERELIRALQSHAVEVMLKPFGEDHATRLIHLLDERSRQPAVQRATWEEQAAWNFVELAQRHKLNGTLLVNRSTPFEGRVVFKQGALARAAYGPLKGMDAVREILQLDDGVYELDAALERPPQKIAHSATELEPGQAITLGLGDSADIRPRLLAVDDERDMLALVTKCLTRAGFEVATAGDGQEAVELALRTPFDLIMADLNMPCMDGWEMLKVLKGDHHTSEIPVIFLSAHDDLRETLRAARAGAFDYLAKTGRSEVVVSAALRAITPRLEVLFHLLVNEPVEVRAQGIGLQWFLRSLARLGSTGVLELRDDYGSYRLEVNVGQPVSVRAEIQRRTVTGIPAFARMLVATMARGTFTHGLVGNGGAPAFSSSMEELILRTCEGLNAAEARATEQRLASTPEHDADPELYALYCRIAPPRKVAFAQGLCERKESPEELARALELQPGQSTEWFRELLRRGVLRLRGL